MPREVPGRAGASPHREPWCHWICCGPTARAQLLVWMQQLNPPSLPTQSMLHEPRKGQHWPYRQHSPAHRGSQPPASSCPPPAGRSWCRIGRSGSPAAGKGVGGVCPRPHHQHPLPRSEASQPPGSPYLLTVLQLVHPELGSLETATVSEIWGEESGSADTAPQCPTHQCHHHPGPGPSRAPAPSPSHSPCPYRSRRWQPGLLGNRCGSWPHSAPSPPCPGGDREALSR